MEHQAFERLCVQEPIETIRALAISKLLGDTLHAEHSPGQAEEISGGEVEDLIDLHAMPDVDEAVAATFGFIGSGRQEAGVNRANRSAANDFEVGHDARALW